MWRVRNANKEGETKCRNTFERLNMSREVRHNHNLVSHTALLKCFLQRYVHLLLVCHKLKGTFPVQMENENSPLCSQQSDHQHFNITKDYLCSTITFTVSLFRVTQSCFSLSQQSSGERLFTHTTTLRGVPSYPNVCVLETRALGENPRREHTNCIQKDPK